MKDESRTAAVANVPPSRSRTTNTEHRTLRRHPMFALLRKTIVLFAALACMLLAVAANATTYYVDTAGNDANDGLTPSTAFAHIQQGIAAAVNRDEVVVADGT